MRLLDQQFGCSAWREYGIMPVRGRNADWHHRLMPNSGATRTMRPHVDPLAHAETTTRSHRVSPLVGLRCAIIVLAVAATEDKCDSIGADGRLHSNSDRLSGTAQSASCDTREP